MFTSARLYCKNGVVVIAPIDMPLWRLKEDGIFEKEGVMPGKNAH